VPEASELPGPADLVVDLVISRLYVGAMNEVGVHEAKTTLSQLLRRVTAGEEIVICRGGTPVAKLVPVAPTERRLLGEDAGRYVVPEDFDAPLPDDLARTFEA
jgi:prevent-host-death family protein